MKVVSLEDLRLNTHCNSDKDCMRDNISECENCPHYSIEWRDIIEFANIYDVDIKGE